MAEVADVKTCSNPGCDQPGTKSCSACKTAAYCCVSCQTADWPSHREECDGHLRKVGKINLDKAFEFHRQQNWMQVLRYGELAATKLKKLKDRRLATVQKISVALTYKFNALNFMGRSKETKECAEERYTLWAMNHLRNPGSINAAFALIQSCIHNNKYERAEHYARHAIFMINDMTDNFIPSDQRSKFLAEASYYLALTTFRSAQAGGILPEGKQNAGEEAVALARQALELHTQLDGTGRTAVANSMSVLADLLDFFNDVDDDEVTRLYEQAISICRRAEGRSSVNVGVAENKLGRAYGNRARRALAIKDLDRYMTNLQMALPHFRNAYRILQANNNIDRASHALRNIATVEEEIRQLRINSEA